MRKKLIREWKKVFESDLQYITYEIKEMINPPALLILEGALGAGKTTFAQSFTEDENTLSPSYSVISETPHVLHADFYRIESREEIIHLELGLYLEDKRYFLVEWGQKHFHSIAKELPEDYGMYILEIEIGGIQSDNEDSVQHRDFKLSEIFED